MNSRFLAFVLASAIALPSVSYAASKPALEVTGWIPYWRVASGTADAAAHLDQLTSVMPFGYIVQNDGSIHDAFDVTGTTSAAFLAAARSERVRIVPTFMWSNGEAIHAVLSKKASRKALVERIVDIVEEHEFDGADIDFEGKYARTKNHFSSFLKELSARLAQKTLSCTIEARTPPEAAFDVIPKNIQRANDFKAIDKYCDRVNLMTYDQGTIDLRLNSLAAGQPYIPVSDPRWVEKVVRLAAKEISKKKILIGVPTYGYEYDLIPLSISGYRYELQWAFNPRYATEELVPQFGVTPVRNAAGELSFTYTPTTTPASTRIVWWSDAEAIRQKVELAKKLGVRGVAIFKLDGGQDAAMWSVLPTRR